MKNKLIIILALFAVLFSVSALADSVVQISPNAPIDSSTLSCNVLVGGSGYTYYWYRNLQLKAISGAYVNPTYTSAGDTWVCQVWKYYGVQVGWVFIGQDTVS
ncbi:hypothetical protein KY308_00515, partial [Candidatus Woesearchaeota archaeon]|nr:hypothetical protein [Candidatus Woesearchaeota archaeon]